MDRKERKRLLNRNAVRRYRERNKDNPSFKARRIELESRPEAKEKQHIKNVLYNKTHKEKKRLLEKAWAKRNPDKIKEKLSNYRARRFSAVGRHSQKEWTHLCSLAFGRCSYCFAKAKLTRDHFIPLSRGGRNDITNIVPSCHSCNSKKKDKLPHQTAHWLASETIKRLEIEFSAGMLK